mgnify:CR=1 FL=1
MGNKILKAFTDKLSIGVQLATFITLVTFFTPPVRAITSLIL